MPELKTLKTKENVDAKKAYYDNTSGIGSVVKKTVKKGKKGMLGSKSQKEKEMSPDEGTLGAKSDPEIEIERGLKAEEDAAYEKLEKQGMSDQGIVNREQLAEFGKDVYRGVKKKGKEFARGFKAGFTQQMQDVKEGAKKSVKDLIRTVKGEDKK